MNKYLIIKFCIIIIISLLCINYIETFEIIDNKIIDNEIIDNKIINNKMIDNEIIIINKYKKIHIWQGDTYNMLLKFMYQPVVTSILNLLKIEIDDNIIDYKINYYNFDEIEENDILLWVGCENIPDFNSLKKRNVYTIYYNTEPNIIMYDSDEIWTYSKYAFIQYNKINNTQIIKFVPIICTEDNVFISYLKYDIKLSFIGALVHRSDKAQIILNDPIIKNNLEEIYNLWSDEAYNDYINNTSNIFINLTKTGTNILPSVRINKLLSHKCIVISEYTNDIDEEYYKGLVYFCKLEDISKVYLELINNSKEKIQEIANNIYINFYNKFNTKNAYKLITKK